jgi:hypothetical protein
VLRRGVDIDGRAKGLAHLFFSISSFSASSFGCQKLRTNASTGAKPSALIAWRLRVPTLRSPSQVPARPCPGHPVRSRAVQRYNPTVRIAMVRGEKRTGVGAERECELVPTGPIHYMRWVTRVKSVRTWGRKL